MKPCARPPGGPGSASFILPALRRRCGRLSAQRPASQDVWVRRRVPCSCHPLRKALGGNRTGGCSQHIQVLSGRHISARSTQAAQEELNDIELGEQLDPRSARHKSSEIHEIDRGRCRAAGDRGVLKTERAEQNGRPIRVVGRPSPTSILELDTESSEMLAEEQHERNRQPDARHPDPGLNVRRSSGRAGARRGVDTVGYTRRSEA